ncbi:MAG: 3'-5' exonuclease [Anaerolineae bacterium]|nr:3'-5' exonuclease [Anaerolineae bacterium]
MSLDILRRVLERENFVILDTETTGLDERDQIVQIALINAVGETLLDTLVRPTRPIPRHVIKVHGITNEMVADAPNLPQIVEPIRALIQGREVIAYNASFDLRMLNQSSRAHNLSHEWRKWPRSWVCAMLAYAEFYGERGRYGFKWQSLENACIQQQIAKTQEHHALADCRLTLQLLRKLRGETPSIPEPSTSTF